MGEVIKGSDVLLLTGFDNKFLRKCPYIIFWTEDKLIKLACFGRNFYEVKYQETDFPSFFSSFPYFNNHNFLLFTFYIFRY